METLNDQDLIDYSKRSSEALTEVLALARVKYDKLKHLPNVVEVLAYHGEIFALQMALSDIPNAPTRDAWKYAVTYGQVATARYLQSKFVNIYADSLREIALTSPEVLNVLRRTNKRFNLILDKSLDNLIIDKFWEVKNTEDYTVTLFNKKLHSLRDEPAMTLKVSNKYDIKVWYSFGKFDRKNGLPAIKGDLSEAYYKDGLLDRDDGPAFKHTNIIEIWYTKGVINAINVPAIKYGDNLLFIRNGKLYNDYDFPVIKTDNLYVYATNGKLTKIEKLSQIYLNHTYFDYNYDTINSDCLIEILRQPRNWPMIDKKRTLEIINKMSSFLISRIDYLFSPLDLFIFFMIPNSQLNNINTRQIAELINKYQKLSRSEAKLFNDITLGVNQNLVDLYMDNAKTMHFNMSYYKTIESTEIKVTKD